MAARVKKGRPGEPTVNLAPAWGQLTLVFVVLGVGTMLITRSIWPLVVCVLAVYACLKAGVAIEKIDRDG